MTITKKVRKQVTRMMFAMTASDPTWKINQAIDFRATMGLNISMVDAFDAMAEHRLRSLPLVESALDAYLDDPTDDRLMVLKTMATVAGVFR